MGDVRHFEDFELDPAAYRLSRQGQVIRLERIPLELLCLLVERCGQIVNREEILERIWGKGVFIDSENSINTAIRKIRRALNDDADAPRFVVTIPAKGYRFVAPVTIANGGLKLGDPLAEGTNGTLPQTRPISAGGPESQLHRPAFRRTALLSVAGLALVAVIIVVARHLTLRPSAPAASISTKGIVRDKLPNKPSVAVLPFANDSGDPGQDYFSDGITDELITGLGRVPNFFVIARTSSFVYKNRTVKAQDLSRELGVKYILEGSINKQPNRLRINTRLIDAASGAQLWSEHYDSPPGRVFALQDQIVQRVVTTLTLQLNLWELGIFHAQWHGTRSLDAYDEFLRGLQYTYAPTREENLKARELFQSAIKRDSGYADAYAMLGFTYARDWISQWSHDSQALKRASEIDQRAVALDDTSTSAHMQLGYTYLLKGQYHQALAETERAIALDPNFPIAHVYQAINLDYLGKAVEALPEVETAMRLDPMNRDTYDGFLGMTYSHMNRYAAAIAPTEKYLVRNPNESALHVFLTIDYIEVGREQDAIAQIREVRRISPGYSLEILKQRMPPMDAVLAQRWYTDLSRAGLN